MLSEYEELFARLFTLSTVEEVHGMMAAFRDASWPASSFEQQAMPIRRLPARRMFQSVTLPANQIDQGPDLMLTEVTFTQLCKSTIRVRLLHQNTRMN